METKEPKKNKIWYKKLWIVIPVGIFVVPIVAITIVAMIYGIIAGFQEASKTQNTTQQTTQKIESKRADIKYIQPDWEITNSEIVGTNYIVATGYLQNNSGEVGIADCNIEFYDREIKWAGGKGFGSRELEPNERYDFTVQVEVTNTGLVSKQNINCEDGVY